MLTFILGKPLSGKSYTVFSKLGQTVNSGKNAVLLVPEQFTFQNERLILHKLGDSVASRVEVTSFTRLYDDVIRNVGGSAETVLSDCDKILFMARALESLKDSLKIWGRLYNNISFAKTVLNIIGEFKVHSVSSGELIEAADSVSSERLSQKLKELALIYDEYDLLVGEKFIDPADRLKKLYDKLLTFSYFKGKTVFIDSFTAFSGGQLKVIERIIAEADEVYISLTRGEDSAESDIFANVEKTVKRIEAIARNHSVKINSPIVLGEGRYNNKSLLKVEKLLSGNFGNETADCENIVICAANTKYDEARFVARSIKKLVRNEGYRFKDFAVVARDSDSYADVFASACAENGVSCFADRRAPLCDFPICAAARALMDSVNFSTENILKFHKTGLGTLSFDEISLIENYCYLWNIDGKIWNEEWTMNPDGLSNRGKDTEIRLEELNGIRRKALEPIVLFKNEFCKNAEQMAAAFVKVFDLCGSAEKMQNMYSALNCGRGIYSADLLKQSYAEFIGVLDSLVRCFQQSNITQNRFKEAFLMSVATLSIGSIPQYIDEVSFGSADRIRAFEPKVVFIIGANRGVFPAGISAFGILNASDRRAVIENGICISDNSIDSSIEEDFLVYRSLCLPTDRLFITYSASALDGDLMEKSAFLQLISSKLDITAVTEPSSAISDDSFPETVKAAFSEYCRQIGNGYCNKKLLEVLSDYGYKDKATAVETAGFTEKAKISAFAAQNLYGKNIEMSASKFDTFNRCRFSYFCRYGLNAKKLEPADFDVMQKGTIVHYVLEKLVSKHYSQFEELTQEEIFALCDRYTDEYLDSVTGYSAVEGARLKFLKERLTRSLKPVAVHIADELKQSDFIPTNCELKIGGSGDVKVDFPFDEGNISLSGSIDRVDRYNGYIRIIDYKTGSKTFKMPDILYGLNMQMLIYLYAVTRADGTGDGSAAGILYQPAKRDLDDGSLAMNGLIKSDEDLYYAMDKEGAGKYIPRLLKNKDGSLSKRNNSFVDTEAFSDIFDLIESRMSYVGSSLLSGDISVTPVNGRESEACKYCDFKAVCRIENNPAMTVEKLSNDEVLSRIREGK